MEKPNGDPTRKALALKPIPIQPAQAGFFVPVPAQGCRL